MKKVFAITLTFNTSLQTHDLLASMAKLKTNDYQLFIVIVDNASLHPFVLNKEERAHLIRSEENTGFSGGNNIGISYALSHGADYILLLNNDTIVDPLLIENLLHALEKGKNIGVAAPKIYFTKGYEFHKDKYKKDELGKVFWYAGGYTDWANVVSVHRGVDEVDQGQYDTTKAVTFASGCCMMVKREVLEKVGVFDEKYFLYFEDADLNERIQQAEYTIIYVPSAILWHSNAGSTGGSGSALQDYFTTRNRMLFGIRYAPLRSKFALLRESIHLFFHGRPMQKRGIKDFYLGRFGKGSYFDAKT